MTEDQGARARIELGKRIKAAREAKRISQAKLGAHAVPPITAQSVVKWEQGRSAPNARTLDAIALLTGKSVKWLLYGVESAEAGGQDGDLSQVGRVIPMVEFSKVTEYLAGGKQASSGMVRTNFPCSGNSFQVFAQDDANSPVVEAGDGLVIDRDRHPRPGKLCFAVHDGEPLIRRYRPRKDHVELVAINEDWPTIEVSEDDIVGAVTEITRQHG